MYLLLNPRCLLHATYHVQVPLDQIVGATHSMGSDFYEGVIIIEPPREEDGEVLVSYGR